MFVFNEMKLLEHKYVAKVEKIFQVYTVTCARRFNLSEWLKKAV